MLNTHTLTTCIQKSESELDSDGFHLIHLIQLAALEKHTQFAEILSGNLSEGAAWKRLIETTRETYGEPPNGVSGFLVCVCVWLRKRMHTQDAWLRFKSLENFLMPLNLLMTSTFGWLLIELSFRVANAQYAPPKIACQRASTWRQVAVAETAAHEFLIRSHEVSACVSI